MTIPRRFDDLILASASPRRKELLARLGFAIRVIAPEVDELPIAGEAPAVHALRAARAKLRAVASLHPDLPVVAADTVVALAGAILGKPIDLPAARSMLARLAGHTHFVFTAVAVGWRHREASHLEASRVTFAGSAGDVLDWYAETGEGADKAGAYALQGAAALFIPRVEGNVQAIVGLPLASLPGLFARVGLEIRRAEGRLAVSPRA